LPSKVKLSTECEKDTVDGMVISISLAMPVAQKKSATTLAGEWH
jgi:hypothetical protein